MSTGEFCWEMMRHVFTGGTDVLLIGRQAVALYGCPVGTGDVDFLVSTKTAEARLKKIAEDFDLVLALEENSSSLFSRSSRMKLVVYMDPPEHCVDSPRKMDILVCDRIQSRFGFRKFKYEDAFSRSVLVKVDDAFSVRLPHVDDLISLKHIAGRAKDREDVSWLRQHRAEILAAYPSTISIVL